MSAAAVIVRRQRRIVEFLRRCQAFFPEAAVLESDIPYSNRWYYRRLVRAGVVRQAGEGYCYLDEDAWREYCKKRLWRVVVTCVILFVLCFLYQIARQL